MGFVPLREANSSLSTVDGLGRRTSQPLLCEVEGVSMSQPTWSSRASTTFETAVNSLLAWPRAALISIATP